MPGVRPKPYHPPRLTPELINKIGTFVRAGATFEKAVESCGVPAEVGERWLALGNAGRKLYRDFSTEIFVARASARVVAETRTFETQPGFWLRYSPEQRVRSNAPFWQSIDSALSVNVNPETGQVNVTQFVGDGLRLLEDAGRPFDPLRPPALPEPSGNGRHPIPAIEARKITCERCGTAGEVSRFNGKYCSPACRKAAWKDRKRAKMNGTNGSEPSGGVEDGHEV